MKKEEVPDKTLEKVSGGFSFSLSNIKNKILSIVKSYHGIDCEYCGKSFRVFASSSDWKKIKKQKEISHKYFLCTDCSMKYPGKSVLPR